jgi:hypothetical protein
MNLQLILNKNLPWAHMGLGVFGATRKLVKNVDYSYE